MDDKVSRREFLEKSGKAAAGMSLALGSINIITGKANATEPKRAKRIAPSDKIVVGMIGTGGMGTGNAHGFNGHPECEVGAVCDVDTNHLENAATALGCDRKYTDFRRLLEQKDIDAVMIGTPDHWHALPFILACQADKDIFCEKPISHNIVEARLMAEAAKKHGRVVQINTWQRSVQHFIDAIDYVRAGKLGRVTTVKCWTLGGSGTGKATPKDPPKHLDWDFWLGPAPKVPYRDNRCHFQWRWYWDYAAGLTGDWGVHMMDIALLGMNQWHPTKVHSVGGRFQMAANDDRDTPDTQMAIYQFPDFVMEWEIRAAGRGIDGGDSHGTEFIGTQATLIVDRGGWQIRPQGDKPMPKESSPRKGGDHIADFVECVKSRKTPRSDIETMSYTTIACHLANLSYRTGKSIDWDGANCVVRNDRNIMRDLTYQREYRKPWSLPKV